ncbi:MAG: type I-C CRISPR-associated protein Cas5 [Alphaproteobacteria bacterium]|nr:type I-C CRISPR-associated protein Cas5 [Alphaproteobacteria bacterium]
METFIITVDGTYACFTRPEMKAERVSYDVITPSAARAVYEAIFWKPAINWIITQIEVLNPIQFTNIRRNEVGCVISSRNVTQAMNNGSGNLGIYIEDERQQRASVLLKDVKYRLHAQMKIKPEALAQNSTTKMHEMFNRRVSKGQCFMQPYLGCREFPGYFSLSSSEEKVQPISKTDDLGWMLYDMDYSQANIPMPRFFRAKMINGRIQVPSPDSMEIRG